MAAKNSGVTALQYDDYRADKERGGVKLPLRRVAVHVFRLASKQPLPGEFCLVWGEAGGFPEIRQAPQTKYILFALSTGRPVIEWASLSPLTG